MTLGGWGCGPTSVLRSLDSDASAWSVHTQGWRWAGDNIRVRVVFRGEGGAGPQSPVPHSLPVFLLLPTI